MTRSEDFMGYGVLFDGKPAGIWPVGVTAARHYIDRKVGGTITRERFEIVSLYTGAYTVPQIEPVMPKLMLTHMSAAGELDGVEIPVT